MDLHWSGQAIFASLVDRDQWMAKFRNYLDGSLNCVEAPDPDYPEGIVAFNNRTGNVLTGPGFTWSFTVVDTEMAMPDGPGWKLHYDLSELPETVAESGSTFQ